jgi:transposase-like protein
MSKIRNKFSPEVRERAVRMVGEHRADYGSEWEAMTSIAGKIGCTAETLRRWCREEASLRTAPAALAADDKARLKLLEREVKELRRANEDPTQGVGVFLRWRSSTATGDDDVVHRQPSQGSGYRADLPGAGDRPVLLS